jgi:hypothetical protein
MKPARFVAAVVAVLVASAALPNTVQSAFARRAWPAVLKLIWGPTYLPNGHSAFPTYQQLGVNVFDVDLRWDEVALSRPANPTNPNDPAYHWPSGLDHAVQTAAAYGIKVCLLVQRTPGWANGGLPNDWAPTYASDYAHFMTAAARRYSSVHYWMIWGEPTLIGNFEPMPPNSSVGPRRYALLLNAAYHALKGVTKHNIVIGGDTYTAGLVRPADFIRWMRLPNGKPAPLDYYGHDPYAWRFPKLSEGVYSPGIRDLNDIDTLHHQLVRTYHRQIKLWLAEWSISSDSGSRAFSFYTTAAGQAQWLTAAYRLVNSVNYVAGLGWFTLLDYAPWIPGHLSNGLMTWDGQPKPAFYAYQQAR